MTRSGLLAAGALCLLTSCLQAQTIRENSIQDGPVLALAFTPDSRRVMTGGFDKGVVFVDAASGKGVRAVQFHDAKVLSVAVSPDGRQWATGHVDGQVFLSRDGWPPRSLEQPRATCVHGVVFSPDNRWVLACTEDGSVRVWDSTEPTLQVAGIPACQSINVCPSGLYALAISPDGQTIATAGLEGTIHVIDLVSGATLHALHGHHDAVYALQFSADGKLLASGSGDGTVRLWDATTGEQRGCLSGHSEAVYSVNFDSRGQRLLSADTAGLTVVHDTRTWATLYSHRLPGKILCAALAPDGRRIAAGNACGRCYLIDLPEQ